ncbi:MAG: hypothetical protein NVSMB65_16860 [Chloroflexota bacterium]
MAGPWSRLHSCRRGPLYFGRSGRNRFDAPGGSAGAFGVLYLGSDAYGAFVETYGSATGVNVISLSVLHDACLARVEAARPLALVDLTGAGLARIGADGRLCAGDRDTLWQRWALALWQHPAAPDGLLYPARHDLARTSVALFDRTEPLLTAHPTGPLTTSTNAPLLADILEAYGFGLV